MKCPVCGGAELFHDIRELSYTYKGESTIIANVEGDYCPACNEVIISKHDAARVSAAMLAFNKEVNAAIVSPLFIAEVRNKLALSQREAGEIFGGGANAFSRYETGRAKPHLSTVKLLRVLDKHPDLLQEIRA
ncbi:antitoxin (plasmid) [Yersinia similis]|uniref:Antitoxin n=1 Tax=Yersinia similis TaxID=367190 RepID=A0ABN4CVM1_9GAMM|nr:type II toxin-antitoxin system MqsA family antitoxin [Yersinia similis]AHK22076.1 antitoxin [Yersinia similis]CFQ66481.1 XRE family transcriptional regulator [Yersinia similis]CNB81889.1 XRE family transcriptional regulator [Yersinia similis]